MMIEFDEQCMRQALVLARKASEIGEVPIGAVVVNPQGIIVGQGYNMVEAVQSQVEHAEVRALQMACKESNNWRLAGYTLYVTLEPCMMCISLASLSRCERVVFGATSPCFGYRLDKEGVLAQYTKHIKNITSGVLANESAKLLQDFFLQKRVEHEQLGTHKKKAACP